SQHKVAESLNVVGGGISAATRKYSDGVAQMQNMLSYPHLNRMPHLDILSCEPSGTRYGTQGKRKVVNHPVREEEPESYPRNGMPARPLLGLRALSLWLHPRYRCRLCGHIYPPN